MDSSSKGKYSDEGRPPPSEMIPGFLRYLAAALSELPLRDEDSMFKRSIFDQSWSRRLASSALTIPSLGLGLVKVLLLALELLDVGHCGDSSNQFSSSCTSGQNTIKCERVRNGDGSSVVNRLNIDIDSAWRRHFRCDRSTNIRNSSLQHRIYRLKDRTSSRRYVYLLDSRLRLAPSALVLTTNFLDLHPSVTSGIAASRYIVIRLRHLPEWSGVRLST